MRKMGFAQTQLNRLAGCVDRRLDQVRDEHATIRQSVAEIGEVAATLDPKGGDVTQRKETFAALTTRFQPAGDSRPQQMAVVMSSFVAGLFVGEATFEELRDNLDPERWFRLPKSHGRRIHRHRHAGVRIVQEGPTSADVLDAHLTHPEPFAGDDLLPYRTAQEPACQREAIQRRTIMKKARSKKRRPLLRADL